jgi:hypothetical protein
MKIELNEIPIRDLVNGYVNDDMEGVSGYNNKLNIRPKYQREFVYNDKQRDAVIDTVQKDFPLNVMYWVKNEKGNYELLDGQQRTISICEYVAGKFSINYKYFHTLQKEEQEQILNYKLMIYICEGTDKEKLDWFKIINIAGEKLYDQEIRNAIYTGEWLTDAKRHFSKNGCPAYGMASDYMSGSAIRQDYLETAIKWISNNNIEQYMADNQHDDNSNDLWLFFSSVIMWVKTIFPNYRREMKGIEWGFLYNRYKGQNYDAKKLEKQIITLMQDEDVTSKKGIYEYLLGGDEKYLNIRTFSDKMKREAYERQKGFCTICGKHFEINEMEGDHITPWHEGGQTIAENCQMLCRDCNRRKSGK